MTDYNKPGGLGTKKITKRDYGSSGDKNQTTGPGGPENKQNAYKNKRTKGMGGVQGEHGKTENQILARGTQTNQGKTNPESKRTRKAGE